MAWKGSGEERIRRFELYRLLEARYNESLAERDKLNAIIAQKDLTIRHLAGELAMAPTVTAAVHDMADAIASGDLVEAFASEQASGPISIKDVHIKATMPAVAVEPIEPASRMTTSNAPPIGKSEMRPARTSVANGEGRALAQSIRERLAQRAAGKK